MMIILKSMYSSVKSRVRFNNKLSEEFYCFLGVRQGESLSPFLFSMFLNDIEEHLVLNGFNGIEMYMTKMFILLYADDIVVFSDSPEGLQNGLDHLYEYCRRWKLKINVQKTKIIVFRKGGILPRNLQFSFNGEILEIVRSLSYLGVVFSSGGSFSKTEVTLAGKAQKAIFKLNKYLYNFPNVGVKHRLDLFDKLIVPILNYSSEVWGFHKANTIERIHTQYCKRILQVKRCSQNDFVYGVLGRFDLAYNRYIRIVKYWLKILTSDDLKYCKIVYEVLKTDADLLPNKVSWVTLLQHLLSSLGFYEVWVAQGVGDANVFVRIFKQRLCDTNVQNWNARIENSPRSTFFKSIVSFGFQYYLKCNVCNSLTIAMSRLLLSSHNLSIETGRWHRPNCIPRQDRKCITCNKLEDEYHFVIECNLYTELRKRYIAKYYWSNPSMYKLKQLFESTNITKLRKLCTYVDKAFKFRKSLQI